MKITNIILALLIVAFLSIAATVGVTKISERSTSQVVIVKSDTNDLINSISLYYTKGYRVVFMTSQGWISGAYSQERSSDYGKTTPVIVVMEK
jgi:hypothetical protein